MTFEQGVHVRNLIQAGDMLANIAFNLKQKRPGEPLDERMIRSAAEMQCRWDDLMRQATDAITAMKKLPCAFDPIAAGA